jgi:NAD dependent epimerase/dehydratase family enzyme
LVTPEFMLKPILGERSLLLFGGQRALPEKLLQHGFRFRFTDIADALRNAELD